MILLCTNRVEGETDMTCIIGLVDAGRVIIGADSVGADVSTYQVNTRKDEKVFTGTTGDGSPFAVGFTSSFRFGQILRYGLEIPKREDDVDLMKFLTVDFINELRATLKRYGFAKKESEQESSDGVFLLGYAGRLFEIGWDYQVGENLCGYAAIGSGAQIALGALHATNGVIANPVERVLLALRAAEAHNAYVEGPMHLVEICRGHRKVIVCDG